MTRNCARCGRPLTSPRSLAAGMGAECQDKGRWTPAKARLVLAYLERLELRSLNVLQAHLGDGQDQRGVPRGS
jgi:hypothetical protein